MQEGKPGLDWKQKLATIIPKFFDVHSRMAALKPEDDSLNKQIKEIMGENRLTEFTAGDFQATISVVNKDGFNLEQLMAKLKKKRLGKGIIKKMEYIDMDALEDAIYKGKIDAASLADCVEPKQTVTLRVKQLKPVKGGGASGGASGGETLVSRAEAKEKS